MNRAEHYAEAERLINHALGSLSRLEARQSTTNQQAYEQAVNVAQGEMRAAQVHALLALAAKE